ncbi:ParB/RepB/Spo0J family partition protein [Periweissella beninensis]|uniref:ParB/RepB/Spo0J family partition protein n=1 Tax=Periweissella beninensis TaxID=504936 RepID=A0ABT0VMB7_9LACO|nr:ParB/RepB/Spo0J family partition protein [Periweissella beninensis]MBM7543939.1 ParB family chromosome partitioning protein [Periweissella beninensis]MCM2437665.1 ParB/RepB/Spo0J family partition protein [Periweissella beninensis]MCT4396141.1 ParB/RepB/Spo0J family partition protein [Periweissella beninensis]
MATTRKKSILGEGKGLGALLSSNNIDIDIEDLNTEKIHKINITDIVANPFQPRITFDPTALEELAESIKNEGVFQPIIVRQPNRTEKKYEIIAGERRFRASKLAEQKNIPAIVRDLSDNQMMELAVVENLQRENLSPLEEAQAYQTLMERLNLTQAQVAKRLGKSRPFIANYLRLLTLPATVKDMVQKNELSMGQARTLLGLNDKQKITPLAKKVLDQGLTVRQLEALVNEYNGMTEPSAKVATKDVQKPNKKPSLFIKAAENQLEEKFGTKVALKGNSKGQGKIEINYLSDNDLNRILEMLNITLD